MSQRAPLCLLSCADATGLAEAIATQLGVTVTPSHDVWFPCGEAKHVIEAKVRGADVYVFQRTIVPGDKRSTYDRFMMLLHAVDAARCADADRITVVVPYLPGTRQDKRKNHIREGISTGMFARLLEAAGVSMVITVEPHNEAMIGCFDPRRVVFESISMTQGFSKFLVENDLVGDVVASTDVGGLEMARRFSQTLQCGLVAMSKERDYADAGVVMNTTLIGDVDGRNVLLMDDIIDTAGSVVSAVDTLWQGGARDVTVAVAHALLSGQGWERLHTLEDRASERGTRFRVVGTSGVRHTYPPPFYYEYPLEPLLARVIRSVNRRGSVRALETPS